MRLSKKRVARASSMPHVPGVRLICGLRKQAESGWSFVRCGSHLPADYGAPSPTPTRTILVLASFGLIVETSLAVSVLFFCLRLSSSLHHHHPLSSSSSLILILSSVIIALSTIDPRAALFPLHPYPAQPFPVIYLSSNLSSTTRPCPSSIHLRSTE